jgi:hypothetical protein
MAGFDFETALASRRAFLVEGVPIRPLRSLIGADT